MGDEFQVQIRQSSSRRLITDSAREFHSRAARYDGYYAAWLVAVVVHAAIVQGSLVADEHGSASFGDDHPGN